MEAWQILITIGIVAFIAEIFTAGFISGSIGIGFLFSAVGSFFGLDAKWQILLFALGVALTYFLIRPVILKYGYRKSNIKTNRDVLLNKKGIVTQDISAEKNTGRVLIDGDDWKARSENEEIIKQGTTVKVVSIDSIVLIVKPLN